MPCRAVLGYNSHVQGVHTVCIEHCVLNNKTWLGLKLYIINFKVT